MGDADYLTFDVDVRRYHPLGQRTTFLGTALLTLQTGSSGQNIPTYMDFTLGGANTVRGWDFASRRGKNQFITSLEIRRTVVATRPISLFGFNFYGGVALAAFGDLGSAWGSGADTAGTIGGGGIGLRIFVPYVDLIRIDFGYGDSFQGLAGIGEKAVFQRNRVR
jgi:outer membrane protein insertion porin family